MATEQDKVYLKVLTPAELSSRSRERSRAYEDSSGSWVSATLTGPCGDTMRIGPENPGRCEWWIRSSGEMVVFTASPAAGWWRLTPKAEEWRELPNISPDYIVERLKELPKKEDHCAKLAHETLMEVVDRYYKSEAGKGCKP